MSSLIIELKIEDFSKCSVIWDIKKQSVLAEKFYTELVSGVRRTFIYTDENEYIAEISIVYDMHDSDYTIPNQRAYISHLIVKKEYRKQGIGRQLVDCICKIAAEEGYRELSIGVDLDNYPAIKLYSEAGFNKIVKADADWQGAYIKLMKTI
ncbi:MAG: GNAT family N-acetyltransferase [Clostridia bacterium]|nr:GNAT family N-acetyltransferase [Clostridia bacterium]